MKYRIKKDWEYEGTKHTVTVLVSGEPKKAIYVVDKVLGRSSFLPTSDEPVIYLELAGKVNFPIQHFISIPLSLFGDRFKPITKADDFYELNNTKA